MKNGMQFNALLKSKRYQLVFTSIFLRLILVAVELLKVKNVENWKFSIPLFCVAILFFFVHRNYLSFNIML